MCETSNPMGSRVFAGGRWALGMALALLHLALGTAQAVTFSGSTTNTAGNSFIPSSGTGGCLVAPQTSGGTIFNVPVFGLFPWEVLEQVTLNLTHTWDSDLAIFLRNPAGTEILELTSGNGGNGDNYTNTVFRDGFPSITTGTPPFTGTFSPEGTVGSYTCGASLNVNVSTLSGFSPGQNGTWQLVIFDQAPGDVGTMVGWSLTFRDPSCTLNLTCPANQTATAASGALSAVVTYPNPTFTGTCTNPVISCVPASGSAFPVGTTTVTCTGTEGTTTAQCSFNVTVNQGPPLQAIPTASGWGLAALGVLLAGAAFWLLRRRG